MSQRSVEILADDGSIQTAALRYSELGLGVTAYNGSYGVTHLASGKRLGPTFTVQAAAEVALRQILDLDVEWRRPGVALATVIRDPADVQRAREILHGGPR